MILRQSGAGEPRTEGSVAAKASEADIAAVVVDYLIVHGYDVYQEVELTPQGIRADIVARRGPELTIIETKTNASLTVLYQAMERRTFAHRIYVAIERPAHAFEKLCSELGIGLYRVYVGSGKPWDPPRVTEQVESQRWKSRPLNLASRLRPEHKTSALAGSPTGGHWSRWRETCAVLTRLAITEPGIDLREALKQSGHHYASLRGAVASMASHVRSGRVPGVKLDHGALYPTDVP
jgi:hypothetical protein